jgi:hypothetical protein
MAKESKNSTKKNVQQNVYQEKNNSKSLIPKKYQDALAVILIGLLLIIFFQEAIFSGSFWGASDNISGKSFATYLKSDEFPIWQPYIFGGLPGFAAMMESAVRSWDVTSYIFIGVSNFFKAIFDSDTARMTFWYILMAAGMYFLLRQHKLEKLISLFGSVAFVFATGIIVWTMIGHNYKPQTFALVPFIFVFIERIKEKFSLLNVALMILTMHIMFEGSHIQLMFYAACAVLIYLIYDLIVQLIKKGNWKAILKTTGALFLAVIMTFLMSSDRLLSVLEYRTFSTRGSASITAQINSENPTENNTKANKDEGKDYEYSTMWSFSPGEMIDFFVPSYHGFGKVDYSGPLTGNQETKIMTYWGQKPFEDAAPYMSAIAMFLALLAIIRYFKENSFIQAITIIMFFGLFLSFGYTFPILYDLFFYHIPMFSSFRAPSMSLALMNLTIPILAAFGLKAICEMSEKFGNLKNLPKKEKFSLNIFWIAIGLFVLSGFIFVGVFENSYLMEVTNSKALQGYGEQAISILAPFILDNVVSDWTIIGFLSILAAAMTYLFVNKKMPKNIFLAGIILLVIIDLWRVDYRPMELIDKSIEKEPFQKTDVINFILQDRQENNERFRICDMSSQVVNSNAYFSIENINGYQPAKLRNFQDMMDIMCQGSTSNVTHPFMWNMMNAKYIITPQELGGGAQPIFQSQQTGAFVYYNGNYCKRAFFVDSVQVAEPITILNNMNESNFNPKTLAFVEKPLEKEIVPSKQFEAENRLLNQIINAENGEEIATDEIETKLPADEFVPKANVIDYKNEYIKIETDTKAQHLLVLSEMYYPAGWHAFIDGEETEIIKTNYAFRSVIVPAGEHLVEFKFISENFLLGKKLSTAGNIVLILALIGGFILEYRRKKQKM